MSNALTIVVVPGYLFKDTDILTPAILRAIAQPNVQLLGTIGTAQLQDGSVTTNILADGVLTADAVGRAKMQDGYIVLSKILDGIFTADAAGRAKFAVGFVNTDLLADRSVTAAKLADGAVGPNQLSQSYLQISDIQSGAYETATNAIYDQQNFL